VFGFANWLPTIRIMSAVRYPPIRSNGKSHSAGDRVGKQRESPHQFFMRLGKREKSQWAVRQGDWKTARKILVTHATPESLGTRTRYSSRTFATDVSDPENLGNETPEKNAQLPGQSMLNIYRDNREFPSNLPAEDDQLAHSLASEQSLASERGSFIRDG